MLKQTHIRLPKSTGQEPCCGLNDCFAETCGSRRCATNTEQPPFEDRALSTKTRSLGDVLQDFSQHRKLMQEELQKVIVGQSEVIEQIFAAIFTRGHCLLVGVPGLAKTLMVSTLSQILDVQFKRIQFTPDLMPSDITGTNVLEEDEHGKRNFRFVHGPIFTNILLADEINRTPPKTQAALLQAMQEREVTVGQNTYALPEPFFTIATQNPIEQEGTYPLPEAQLDRFMFNIKVDYPSLEEEERILASTTRSEKVEIRKVLSGKSIVNLQKLVGSVAVSQYIIKYVSRLVRATRPKDEMAPEFIRDLVDWGAGPRAGQFLIQGGKALAAMEGRFSVAIEDVQKIAIPVLRHRISTNFQAQAEGMTNDDVILRLIREIPTPEIPKFEQKA
ncbi:MAG: MoxR family ATPase [Planctomycetaceae bacterium]|nr:MoxR family ATPase [Planctomycetaceae bacterium]